MFKKLFKDKRGVAIETAIIFMLIMFSFCSVLFIVSYIEKVRDNIGNFNMNLPYQIEQIGEDFYDACLDDRGDQFIYEQGDYKAITNCNTDIYVMEVIDINTNKVVLEVRIDNTAKKITKWCFYSPLNDNALIRKIDSDGFDEVD